MEQKTHDYYRNLLKKLCKVHNISLKLRFENVDDIVVIRVKNHLKVGVDLECIKVLNLIHQTVGSIDIKYNQQLCLYPNGNRLDRIDITFDKKDYKLLNKKLETGDI